MATVESSGRVATLQLSNGSSTLLLRLSKRATTAAESSVELTRSLHAGLQSQLENSSVLKVGVGIAVDRARIAQHLGVHIRGCVDLTHVATRAFATTAGDGASATRPAASVSLSLTSVWLRARQGRAADVF